MDYTTLTFHSHNPSTLSAPRISDWYEEQTHTINSLTPDQVAWLYAQGWVNSNVTYDGYGNASGTLKRTQIKPREVLDDLIADYVDAYNDGRDTNDDRYDELVTLYIQVKIATEKELVGLYADDTTYDGLIETIISQISIDYTSAETDMEGSMDDYGDSRRTAIETQFNSVLANRKTDLVNRGMYNTTVWDSVTAGVERERAIALAAIEDSIYEMQLKLKDRLYALKTDMRDRILAARDRLRSSMQSNQMARTTLRNNTLGAMFSFMERRVDGYPDISSVGQIAAQIGAGAPVSFAP